MEAAVDCLECLPQGLDILDASLSEETNLMQKLRIFQFIADFYATFTKPLWSQEFEDLQVSLDSLAQLGTRKK